MIGRFFDKLSDIYALLLLVVAYWPFSLMFALRDKLFSENNIIGKIIDWALIIPLLCYMTPWILYHMKIRGRTEYQAIDILHELSGGNPAFTPYHHNPIISRRWRSGKVNWREEGF